LLCAGAYWECKTLEGAKEMQTAPDLISAAESIPDFTRVINFGELNQWLEFLSALHS
jgi:hypothetical protein